MTAELAFQQTSDGTHIWRLWSVDGGTLLAVTGDTTYIQQLRPVVALCETRGDLKTPSA